MSTPSEVIRHATPADLPAVAAIWYEPGLGRRLLARVLPGDGRVCCTVSSPDPRALPLYVRAGLRPWWPHLQLRGASAGLRVIVDISLGHAFHWQWMLWPPRGPSWPARSSSIYTDACH